MSSPLIGEGFVGSGPNAAHINTVLGASDGPAGVAWATALATPRQGHVPFVAVLQPGLAVKPLTLFVNKAPIEGGQHGLLTWGAAQAGVASGVAESVASGVIDKGDVDALVLVAAVWVDPAAHDEEEVFRNNREATITALRNGRDGAPSVDDVIAAKDAPTNPFFRRTTA
ncbi:MAG: formaldehyde-activating enzyme [Actinomycetales bacterium]